MQCPSGSFWILQFCSIYAVFVPVPRMKPMQPSYLPSVLCDCAARRVVTVSLRIITFFLDTSCPRRESSARRFSPKRIPMTSGAFISLLNPIGTPSWSGSIRAAYEKQKAILSLLSTRRSISPANTSKNSFALTSLSNPGIRVRLKSCTTGLSDGSNSTRHVLRLVPPASITMTVSPALGSAFGEQ